MLPIHEIIASIVQTLSQQTSLVIEAPPGAGKTTVVPQALLQAGFAEQGEILISQPRRLAAQMAASYVAQQLGEKVGERCGYQVRFESAMSSQTKICYLTEALLLRRLCTEPGLSGVAMVILDEFHERHIEGDLNLAILRTLQTTLRHDLKLIVMSATLEGEQISRYLNNCPRITSAGRVFPVDIEYSDGRNSGQRSLEHQVVQALQTLGQDGLHGDVLVFLPGMREIRKTATACEGWARSKGVEICVLHGELSGEQQQRVIQVGSQPKLILSTNIAETSITVEGVVAVIDSGLCRRASHQPWSGFSRLEVSKISQASAKQRTGRAGRVRPGRCIRLYSQADYQYRPLYDQPEIHRLDVSSALLIVSSLPPQLRENFLWFEAPPQTSLAAAEQLLIRLGALSKTQEITALGRAMMQIPTHPRLARLLLEGALRQIPKLAAMVAALLSEGGLFRKEQQDLINISDASADVLVEVERFENSRRNRKSSQYVYLWKVIDQLNSLIYRMNISYYGLNRQFENLPQTVEEREEAICMALLMAFPDRVSAVRNNKCGDREVLFCGGGSAPLSPHSRVRSADWIVAIVVNERRDHKHRTIQVTNACTIEPEWLLEFFPDYIHETETWRFNWEREALEGQRELCYENLVLESTPCRQLPPHAVEIFQQAIRSAGLAKFVESEELLATLLARCQLVTTFVEGFIQLNREWVEQQLMELSEGCRSFAELRSRGLIEHIQTWIRSHYGNALEEWVPTHIRLAGGPSIPIHYELDKLPWIATYLQDFFGTNHTPTIAKGRIPLVLHLLAPNRRAVQVSSDLASFWQLHYPKLRGSLMRRYPKHFWPENPLQAAPLRHKRR